MESGRTRGEAINWAIQLAAENGGSVLGLDFAFGFPAWYPREREWERPDQVWAGVRDEVDALLDGSDPRFWGRAGSHQYLEQPTLRATDLKHGGKSVFQIAGSGAVGTGSLRGMPHLLTLEDAGFAIWPFDTPSDRAVVEIYPRLFAPGIRKSRWSERLAYAHEHFPEQSSDMRERAAGSEDAFDAAVSALAMSRHLDALATLERADSTSPEAIEGAIWAPTSAYEC